MVHRIAAGELPAWLRPGARVFVEGAAGEPTILLDALAAAPDASRGVEYLQVTIPGVNRRDPASFHPEARFTGFFVPPEFHASFAAGRMRFVPLNYNAVHAQVAAIDFDLALLSLSPPNAEGLCSFGVVADFPQSVRAKKIIAEINPRMPFVPGAPTIPFARLDAVVETDHPLLEFSAGALDDKMQAIGRNAAAFIRDGDTVQIGIGKPQAAVMKAIADRRNLAFHSGMLTEDVLDLILGGAMTGRVLTGIALGAPRLYDYCRSGRILFREAGHTHDFRVIAAIPNFVSVNAALEVDLLGQINSESLKGKQISGVGGFADFQRGAAASSGGRSIVCLAATAGAKASRIVPRLEAGVVATGARPDADIIVTEYGAAELRGRDVDQRAKALIAIAAPDYREELSRAWRDLRARM